MEKQCLVCGKVYIDKSHNHCRIYCSKRCGKIEWRKNNPDKNREQWKRYNAKKKKSPLPKVCIYCGKPFMVNIHNPYQKFCPGYSCRNAFWRLNNGDKYREMKRLSRLRNKEHIQQHNSRYKDLIRFSGNRRKALERDNFLCKKCGGIYPNVQLIVHHIDGSRENDYSERNNNLDNLQTLCRACHARIHYND